MNGGRHLHLCVIAWRRAFTREPKSYGLEVPPGPGMIGPDLWGRPHVVATLRGAGLFDFAALKGIVEGNNIRWKEWKVREAVKAIAVEIAKYQAYAKRVRELNHRFNELEEYLSDTERRLLGECNHWKFADVKKCLKTCAAQVALCRIAIETRERDFWRSPRVVVSVLSIKGAETHPQRRLEFDGRFQKRVASILRLFLPLKDGIDRKTISSLVVLIYLVAGLATDQKGYAIIEPTGRELTIANVDQMLKRAGLR